MYLEISSRQTGKTTRMIKSVIDNIINHSGLRINIFLKDYLRAVNIKNLILKELKEYKNIKIDIIKDFYIQGNTNTPYIQGKTTYYFFINFFIRQSCAFFNEKNYYDDFDEFDYKFHFDKNGYYCTTPKNIRTRKQLNSKYTRDPLLKLLKKNNYMYTRTIKNINEEDLYIYKQALLDEKFQTEILGRFIEE